MNQLDHIVLAAPDLAAAKARFEADTGVLPIDGGAHPGRGTRNALISFGETQYLEILAPDPDQDTAGTFAEHLAELAEPTLFHWAIRVTNLDAARARAEAAGFAPGATLPTQRSLPSGELLAWELMGIGGHDLGGLVPFYIDWQETPHPATTSPVVGALTTFEVTVPADSGVLTLLDPPPEHVQLATGSRSMRVSFDSPKGPVIFTTGGEQPLGFRLTA
jgi:catechol 2,3-dioxygenase-like lactoylglutathione lyase family enzyme